MTNNASSTWANLLTEQRNPASVAIDEMTTLDLLGVMNEEDQKVPLAVQKVLPEVARAVDYVVTSFQECGKLIYVGAGSSGRLGVLDASECPPTFGVEPDLVQGVIAGGEPALTQSQEGAEDSKDQGVQDLRLRQPAARDTVLGIAASGVTPFVVGALEEARAIGATTVFLTCNPDSIKKVRADVHIAPNVGPEVVTGSTRLKAGTATKLILNMITTAAMVRMGKVYENLMVDMMPTCDKLRDRAERIISTLTGLSAAESRNALKCADNELKTALVMVKRAVTKETARQLLLKNDYIVKKALA